METRGRGATDCGTVRERNEDSYVIDDMLGVYMVCDGMGGHAGGERASQTAVSAIHEHLDEKSELIGKVRRGELHAAVLAELIEQAIIDASALIWSLACSEPALSGMGTTVTVAICAGRRMVMGHVGDSRLYLVRGGEAHQLSRDHTLAAELLRQGTPTDQDPSEVDHVLTRAVGIFPSAQVDTLIFDILPGDRVLLCSDGLSNIFTGPRDVAQTLLLETDSDPGRLVLRARHQDGADNATAIVVEVIASESDYPEREREVLLTIATLQRIYLLSTLSLDELLKVLERMEVVDVSKGTTVIEQGDHSDMLFVILQGTFRVSADGKEVAILESGDHFGEMAFISRRPRSATVTALERSRVLVMDRTNFEHLVRAESAMGVKMLWALATELSLRMEGRLYSGM